MFSLPSSFTTSLLRRLSCLYAPSMNISTPVDYLLRLLYDKSGYDIRETNPSKESKSLNSFNYALNAVLLS